MTVAASALFAKSMREFLLAKLPAQVATRNSERAACLLTPQAGPWIVTSGMTLSLSLDGTTFTTVTLTTGSRTAAQIATDIEGVLPGVASATADGRLKVLSTTAPSGTSTTSAIHLAADTTGANELLGWDPGGEVVTRAPLIAPTTKGVCDGEPMVFAPFATGRMVIIIGDRGDVEIDNGTRKNERSATLAMRVMVPMATQEYDRSREEIQSACECINDALGTTMGSYLAQTTENIGVLKVRCKSLKVSGSPWLDKKQNFLCDIADLVFTSLVHQRPSAT